MGRTVDATLQLLEGTRAGVELGGFLEAGRAHLAACRAVVHEERRARDVDWDGMRGWVADAQGAAGFFSVELLDRRPLAS
jgi:hypothetical protein